MLFLSRLAPAKGMWVLVEAAAWVKSTYPVAPIQFIIAGDGPEFESLAARVQDMGLHNSVRLLGYVRGEEKYAAFRQAYPSSTLRSAHWPKSLVRRMEGVLKLPNLRVRLWVEKSGSFSGTSPSAER